MVNFLYQALGQIEHAIRQGNKPSLVKAFNIMIKGTENDFETAINILESLRNRYRLSDFLNKFGLCLADLSQEMPFVFF